MSGERRIFGETDTAMDYRIEEEAQRCLQCGGEVYGRKDKKFCSEECKNHWHNSRTSPSRNYRNRILTNISSNYRILRTLLSLGSGGAEIADLEAMGFKRNCVTGYTKNRNGGDELRCFDIKYRQSQTRIYDIGMLEMLPRI